MRGKAADETFPVNSGTQGIAFFCCTVFHKSTTHSGSCNFSLGAKTTKEYVFQFMIPKTPPRAALNCGQWCVAACLFAARNEQM